jgi:hypothetical protein
MYRMRWSLDDIAPGLGLFRGPHEESEDTELGWEAFCAGAGRIGDLTR